MQFAAMQAAEWLIVQRESTFLTCNKPVGRYIHAYATNIVKLKDKHHHSILNGSIFETWIVTTARTTQWKHYYQIFQIEITSSTTLDGE